MSVVKIRSWLATLLLLALVACGGGNAEDAEPAAGEVVGEGRQQGFEAGWLEVGQNAGTDDAGNANG